MKFYYYIIIGVVVVAAIVVLLVIFGKGRRLTKQIGELKNAIDALDTVTLREKLAKLEVIGKNNVVFASVYEDYITQFNDNEEYRKKEIDPDIEKAELEVSQKQYELVSATIENTDSKIKLYSEKVNFLKTRLDDVLKDDVDTRSYEDNVRAAFRQYKELYLSMKADVIAYKDELESREHDIESLFKGYESNLEGGRFDDAKESLHVIEQQINDASKYLINTREAIVKVTKELPGDITDLINLFNEMVNDQYPLKIYGIPSAVESLKRNYNELKEKLRLFNSQNVLEEVIGLQDEVKALKDKLENERQARITFEEKFQENYEKANEIERTSMKEFKEFTSLSKVYSIDRETKEQLTQLRTHINSLSGIRKNLDAMITSNYPYLARAEKIKELEEKINTVDEKKMAYQETIKSIKQEVEEAYDLVYSATEDVRKAHLKIRKTNHENLRKKYYEPINHIYHIIEDLNKSINVVPIDTALVTGLVKQVKMERESIVSGIEQDLEDKQLAEELIMFGNEYRSDFGESERYASKAENAYFSGDFKAAIELAKKATSSFPLPKKLVDKLQQDDIFLNQQEK